MITRSVGFLFPIALVASDIQAVAGDLEDGLAAARSGDEARAAALWAPLVSRGTADEQLRIAQVYFEGSYGEASAVQKNDVEAAKWFLLAAKQGNPEAQEYIGSMYSEGRGVARDQVRGYMWLTLSGDHVVRDRAARRMTATQIKLGEEMVIRCKAALKDCN